MATRGTFGVTTSEQQLPVPPDGRWTFGFIQNVSDTKMVFQIGTLGDALTTANGIELAAGEKQPLVAPPEGAKVAVIHGGSGSKELRYNFA